MYVMLDLTIVSTMLVELLRVDLGDVTINMRHYRGPHVRFSLL